MTQTPETTPFVIGGVAYDVPPLNAKAQRILQQQMPKVQAASKTLQGIDLETMTPADIAALGELGGVMFDCFLAVFCANAHGWNEKLTSWDHVESTLRGVEETGNFIKQSWALMQASGLSVQLAKPE